MKDKWHRKLPFVKVIKKGVLHQDQTCSAEAKEKEKKERKTKKERKKKGKRRRKLSFLMVFQRTNSKCSMVKKRVGLRSKR